MALGTSWIRDKLKTPCPGKGSQHTRGHGRSQTSGPCDWQGRAEFPRPAEGLGLSSLPSVQEALGLNLSTKTRCGHRSSREVEEGSGVRSRPLLHGEFEAT